jgi:hypothetical protein
MSSIFRKAFLLASIERAIKTFAQVLLALFATGQANILNVDWGSGLAVAGTAVLVSFLTSIVSANVGPEGSPSLVEYEPAVEADPAT